MQHNTIRPLQDAVCHNSSSAAVQFFLGSAALPLQFHFGNVPVPVSLSQADAYLVSTPSPPKGGTGSPLN